MNVNMNVKKLFVIDLCIDYSCARWILLRLFNVRLYTRTQSC